MSIIINNCFLHLAQRHKIGLLLGYVGEVFTVLHPVIIPETVVA